MAYTRESGRHGDDGVVADGGEKRTWRPQTTLTQQVLDSQGSGMARRSANCLVVVLQGPTRFICQRARDY